MPKKNWKTNRPSSMASAIEACVDYARERHQVSIDRLADLMGLPSRWALYKWIESGNLPLRLVPAFETGCQCDYVTQYLAASARKLVIPIPTGRGCSAGDVMAVQGVCADAVAALMAFAAGKMDQGTCVAALTTAIEQLAAERAQVATHDQPELDLT